MNKTEEETIDKFLEHFENQMIDTPKDIQKVIDENFWDLF